MFFDLFKKNAGLTEQQSTFDYRPGPAIFPSAHNTEIVALRQVLQVGSNQTATGLTASQMRLAAAVTEFRQPGLVNYR